LRLLAHAELRVELVAGGVASHTNTIMRYGETVNLYNSRNISASVFYMLEISGHAKCRGSMKGTYTPGSRIEFPILHALTARRCVFKKKVLPPVPFNRNIYVF
jgi:hypothetical protein